MVEGLGGPAAAVAMWLLGGLGATTVTGPGRDSGAGAEVVLRPAGGAVAGRGRLIAAGEPLAAGGLPPATLDYASGLALAAATVAALRTGGVVDVREVGVAVQVRLPEVMAAAYSSRPAMVPRPPRAAPGGGWVQADLGRPGDEEDFSLLRTVIGPGADARELAAAAQEWRLPVCDHRPREARAAVHPVRTEASAAPGGLATARVRVGTAPLRGVTVCDLTAMWAGPLTTWILAGLGAEVVKVEPAFRPDGTRALDGRGIHPGGVQTAPGRDSAMWNALNAGKAVVDWDLRRSGDRERAEALLARSDLLVESFSPRVLANLGLERILGAGRPARVSMPAFPPGPQRDWVAYGPGIHAVLGLGWPAGRADGRPATPAVSYPDPLNGLAGALAALAALAGWDRGRPVARAETTLYGSSQPLLAWPGPPLAARPDTVADPAPGHSPLGPEEAAAGRRLLDMARAAGLMEDRPVAGHVLPHPGPLLRPASV